MSTMTDQKHRHPEDVMKDRLQSAIAYLGVKWRGAWPCFHKYNRVTDEKVLEIERLWGKQPGSWEI